MSIPGICSDIGVPLCNSWNLFQTMECHCVIPGILLRQWGTVVWFLEFGYVCDSRNLFRWCKGSYGTLVKWFNCIEKINPNSICSIWSVELIKMSLIYWNGVHAGWIWFVKSISRYAELKDIWTWKSWIWVDQWSYMHVIWFSFD